MKTKKLMTAALAVAALATASIAAGCDARSARRAWRRLPRRLSRRREVLPRRRAPLRPPLARPPPLALQAVPRLRLCLQHLLEVHPVRPRERLQGAVLITPQRSARPARGNGSGGFYLIFCSSAGSSAHRLRYRSRQSIPGPSHGEAARAPENLLTVLPPELAAALFATARPHRLKADQTLFTAGDPGDGCYRVEQGLLKVSVVSPSGGERILAILGPGALVGEFAMIDAQPRSASVTAARDSELSFISRASFEQVAARASGRLSAYRQAAGAAAARHQQCRRGDELPLAQGPRRAGPAQPRRGVRQRRRLRPHPDPPEGHPERPRRHGGDRARERQPHPQRLDARQAGEPARRLLLPGEPRRAGAAKPRCEQTCRAEMPLVLSTRASATIRPTSRTNGGNACRSFWARASIAIAWSRTGPSCPTAGT